MKRIVILSITVLFFSSVVHSAELYSPFFPPEASGDTLVCSVLNAGAKDITGSIQICGIKACIKTCELGGGLGGSGILSPERFDSCSAIFDGSSGSAYCKITFNGNPRDVRLLACLIDDITGAVTACVPVE